MSSLKPANTCEESLRSHFDPKRNVCKRQRRTGCPINEAPQTLTSYTPRDTDATSSNTGADRGDDSSGAGSSHGAEDTPAHRSTLVQAGISAQARAELTQGRTISV